MRIIDLIFANQSTKTKMFLNRQSNCYHQNLNIGQPQLRLVRTDRKVFTTTTQTASSTVHDIYTVEFQHFLDVYNEECVKVVRQHERRETPFVVVHRAIIANRPIETHQKLPSSSDLTRKTSDSDSSLLNDTLDNISSSTNNSTNPRYSFRRTSSRVARLSGQTPLKTSTLNAHVYGTRERSLGNKTSSNAKTITKMNQPNNSRYSFRSTSSRRLSWKGKSPFNITVINTRVFGRSRRF